MEMTKSPFLTGYGGPGSEEIKKIVQPEDITAPSGSELVTMDYDLRGRLTLANYADAATPDITYTYDHDDNPLTVNRSGVNWTYAFNEMSLPISATLTLDSRTYAQSYTYSNAAALTG